MTVTLAVSLATPLLIEKAVDGYVAEGNEKGCWRWEPLDLYCF